MIAKWLVTDGLDLKVIYRSNARLAVKEAEYDAVNQVISMGCDVKLLGRHGFRLRTLRPDLVVIHQIASHTLTSTPASLEIEKQVGIYRYNPDWRKGVHLWDQQSLHRRIEISHETGRIPWQLSDSIRRWPSIEKLPFADFVEICRAN
jgi:hypothetical protein